MDKCFFYFHLIALSTPLWFCMSLQLVIYCWYVEFCLTYISVQLRVYCVRILPVDAETDICWLCCNPEFITPSTPAVKLLLFEEFSAIQV